MKDSLHIAKYALSDLNYKVKDLENEKASLTTTLKILYQESHQPYEYCAKQKDANVDLHNNCLNKTKSVMTQIDSDIIHSQSRLSDEPIIVLDNEGAGLIKANKSSGVGRGGALGARAPPTFKVIRKSALFTRKVPFFHALHWYAFLKDMRLCRNECTKTFCRIPAFTSF